MIMASEAHDIVVIGGGIIGASLAYYLAKASQDVCVVEKGFVGSESSGRCAGGIGQSHREPPDLPLAMRSVQLWKNLSDELDIDIEYRQHGNLRLAWTEEHADKLKAMVERERSEGLECYFLDPQNTHELVPEVTQIYLGSVHCPSDGSANPYKTCFALGRAAKKQGAVIHEFTEVTGINFEGGRVSAIQTSNGRIEAKVIVIAAGAWASVIGKMIGVKIPIYFKRSHLVVTERLPFFLKPFTSTDFYGYFRQTLSGTVIIGYPAMPVNDLDRHVTFDAISIATQRAARLIPRLRDAAIIRAFTGFTEWTSDYLPIIGPVKPYEGLYVAAGFCGLGFAIGPGVGETMAELVMTGRTSLSIDVYSLNRFAQADP
jgi:sarcosine oxidase subunit beta